MESRSFSLIRMKCEIREMRFETKIELSASGLEWPIRWVFVLYTD